MRVRARAGEKGEFVLRPLVGGEHEVYATGAQYGFAPSSSVWAEAGAEDVVLHPCRVAALYLNKPASMLSTTGPMLKPTIHCGPNASEFSTY